MQLSPIGQVGVPHTCSSHGMSLATAIMTAVWRGVGHHVALPPSATGCLAEREGTSKVKPALAPTCSGPNPQFPLWAVPNKKFGSHVCLYHRAAWPLTFYWYQVSHTRDAAMNETGHLHHRRLAVVGLDRVCRKQQFLGLVAVVPHAAQLHKKFQRTTGMPSRAWLSTTASAPLQLQARAVNGWHGGVAEASDCDASRAGHGVLGKTEVVPCCSWVGLRLHK